MVAFEISIATLNHLADRHLVLPNTRGRWTAFVKLAEWDRAGPRVPQALLERRLGSKTYQPACPNQRAGTSAAPAHGASDDPVRVRAHCDNPLLAPIGPALSNSEFKTREPDAPS